MAISVQPANSTPFFALQISDTLAHSSNGFNLLSFNYAGIQLNTTGTLAGAWSIQVSNDSGKNWADITSAFTPLFATVVGSPNSQFGQCVPLVGQLVRVTFTATSGSGVASASICLKGSTN